MLWYYCICYTSMSFMKLKYLPSCIRLRELSGQGFSSFVWKCFLPLNVFLQFAQIIFLTDVSQHEKNWIILKSFRIAFKLFWPFRNMHDLKMACAFSLFDHKHGRKTSLKTSVVWYPYRNEKQIFLEPAAPASVTQISSSTTARFIKTWSVFIFYTVNASCWWMFVIDTKSVLPPKCGRLKKDFF